MTDSHPFDAVGPGSHRFTLIEYQAPVNHQTSQLAMWAAAVCDCGWCGPEQLNAFQAAHDYREHMEFVRRAAVSTVGRWPDIGGVAAMDADIIRDTGL